MCDFSFVVGEAVDFFRKRTGRLEEAEKRIYQTLDRNISANGTEMKIPLYAEVWVRRRTPLPQTESLTARMLLLVHDCM
jgi:hypothetical protein